jgi:hypothetical protein
MISLLYCVPCHLYWYFIPVLSCGLRCFIECLTICTLCTCSITLLHCVIECLTFCTLCTCSITLLHCLIDCLTICTLCTCSVTLLHCLIECLTFCTLYTCSITLPSLLYCLPCHLHWYFIPVLLQCLCCFIECLTICTLCTYSITLLHCLIECLTICTIHTHSVTLFSVLLCVSPFVLILHTCSITVPSLLHWVPHHSYCQSILYMYHSSFPVILILSLFHEHLMWMWSLTH